MQTISSLQEAQEASERVFSTSEWEWLEDKLEQTCVDDIQAFEGHIPPHMQRSLVSTIVEQGFERGGNNRSYYYYHLYSDDTEYRLEVKRNNSGRDKVILRAEYCPEDL